MGCCDGDCCAKWCCCCCSIIQEARTLAYFESKGNAYVLSKEGYDAPEGDDKDAPPGSVAYEENAAKAAERRGDEQRAAKAARNKKASKGGYGHLPPHHPAAVQAANVAKRDKMKEREQTVLQKKCEKRLTKGELWHVIDHAPEFPQPGKKMAMRGPFKRYLDAQRHGVTCDAGMPKWWEVCLHYLLLSLNLYLAQPTSLRPSRFVFLMLILSTQAPCCAHSAAFNARRTDSV